MLILRYLWIVILSIVYIAYAVSAGGDIILCIIEKEKPTVSTIIFIVGTLLFAFLASFIYWTVTL